MLYSCSIARLCRSASLLSSNVGLHWYVAALEKVAFLGAVRFVLRRRSFSRLQVSARQEPADCFALALVVEVHVSLEMRCPIGANFTSVDKISGQCLQRCLDMFLVFSVVVVESEAPGPVFACAVHRQMSNASLALAPRSRENGSPAMLSHYYLGATELSQVEVWEVSELMFRAN